MAEPCARNLLRPPKRSPGYASTKHGAQRAYLFDESGLSINALFSLAEGEKRAAGFELSDGKQLPQELADKFKFARQKSKLSGTIRESYFGI